MEVFDGQLYVSSTHCVYRLEDGKLKPVDFGDDVPLTCYHLTRPTASCGPSEPRMSCSSMVRLDAVLRID